MGREESIQAILETLADAEAASGHAELGPLFMSARNAIRASARRACMNEPRTSAAASLSVAGGAMAPIAAACRIGEGIGAELGSHLAKAVRLSYELVGPTKGKPCKSESHDVDPPKGWKRLSGGEFKRRSKDGHVFWIVHRQHVPGGDWSLFYGALPIGASETPVQAAMLSRSLEGLMAASAPPEATPAS